MAIANGDKIPQATFKHFSADGMQEITTSDLLDGKRVVLFSVPGAFTPTCNDTHLPGFLIRGDEIRAKGIDTIACVSVNDAFVMSAWGKATNVGDSILMLADGNGEFARAVDLELDGSGFGLGMRSRRFAMIIDDGVVRYLGLEAGPEVGVSSADAVLAALSDA